MIDLDGNNDYVNLGIQPNLLIQNDLTLSIWINADTLSGVQVLIGNAANTEIEAGNIQYSLFLLNDVLYLIWERLGGVNITVANDASSGFSTNEWVHICATRTLTSGLDVRFYVNGSQVGSTHTGYAAPTGGTLSPTYIGVQGAILTEDFNGEVGDVAIWDTALSDDEVYQLYASKKKRMPLQIQYNNLQLYLPLDDVPVGSSGNGQTFRDESKNGYNGTGAGTCTSTGNQVLSY